jgi:cobalamin biosynthetic protein CobC
MNDIAVIDPIEHGGALTAACERFGGRAENWLDLSTGINPVATEFALIDGPVWQRLPDARLMTDAGLAAASYYGTQSGVIPLPVAGAQNAIQMLPSVTDGPVAVLGPTYEEYRHLFSKGGRRVDIVADLSDIEERHRVAVVVNPNNPDGRTVKPDDLLQLADELAARRGYLIVDEAFADMRPDISVAKHAGSRKGLIVLRSFGKYFGLAGLRLGFVLADNGVLGRISRMQGPWPVSGPALAVARSILCDAQAIKATTDRITSRCKALEAVLTGAGLTIVGGTELFALVEDERAGEIHDALCRKHILTRKFGYAPRWLRFGLCPDVESDQRLGAALSDMN